MKAKIIAKKIVNRFKNIDVAVLIVTYNSENYIDTLLKSIHSQKFDLEKLLVLIIDNNSTDGTVARLRELSREFDGNIVIIALSENVGFAPTNNLGLILLKRIWGDLSGKYIIFLNPDTKLLDSRFLEIASNLLHSLPFIGFSTIGENFVIDSIGSYVDLLGSPQEILHGIRLSRNLYNLLSTLPPIYFVPSVCFAATAIRGEVFEKIGLLKNGYIMYFEDTELSLRAWSSGIPVAIYRKFIVWHKRGGSITRKCSRCSTFENIHMAKNILLLNYEYFNFIIFLAKLLIYISIALTLRKGKLLNAVVQATHLILKGRVKKRRLPRGIVPFSFRTVAILWAIKYYLHSPNAGLDEALTYGVKRASFEYLRYMVRKYYAKRGS